MTVSLDKPLTAQSVAREVADNIEKFGHYQGQDRKGEGYEAQGCCILRNPAMSKPGSWATLSLPLARRIGTEVVENEGQPFAMSGAIFDWNDRTPTSEVLDTLRSL